MPKPRCGHEAHCTAKLRDNFDHQQGHYCASEYKHMGGIQILRYTLPPLLNELTRNDGSDVALIYVHAQTCNLFIFLLNTLACWFPVYASEFLVFLLCILCFTFAYMLFRVAVMVSFVVMCAFVVTRL